MTVMKCTFYTIVDGVRLAYGRKEFGAVPLELLQAVTSQQYYMVYSVYYSTHLLLTRQHNGRETSQLTVQIII